MPKIEINRKNLCDRLGRSYTDEEFKNLLVIAKAELDENLGEKIKVECNDTNRPDLWSMNGLARLLRVSESCKEHGAVQPSQAIKNRHLHDYSFFSTSDLSQNSDERVVMVNANLQGIRPYIVAFAARGKVVNKDILEEIIQTQEKICWNYGQKRRAIAMGVYRSDLIQYPIHYQSVDPNKTAFVPLGMNRSLTLREINTFHPKGKEYGQIVSGFPRFPFLCDNNHDVLSYPPVINSQRIGAVEIGNSELFIEMTGIELKSLMLAASIVACNMADEGFNIQPVKIVYPFDTEFGRVITTPYYFQKAQTVTVDSVNKLLGVNLSAEEIQSSLERMGNTTECRENIITVQTPVYRNDFLHEVDLVEDVMIGCGMDRFEPELPSDFTVGRITEEEEFTRHVRDILVGLGFQEMIFNYLGSAMDYIFRMNPRFADIQSTEPLQSLIDGENIVQILNPMSENYEFLRNSILPALLNAESISAHAPYPHNIFEVGKTVLRSADNVYGTETLNFLGFLIADKDAGLNLVTSQVSTLMYYLGREYTLIEAKDKRFIPGRAATIIVGEKEIGVLGELHPGILENWGITVPVSACEVYLDKLMEK